MSVEVFRTLAQVALDAIPTTIYTCPAATQAIVKAIMVVNTLGAQNSIEIWQNGSANVNRILPPTTVETGEFGTYDGSITLQAGESLVGRNSGSGAAGCTVTVEGLEVLD